MRDIAPSITDTNNNQSQSSQGLPMPDLAPLTSGPENLASEATKVVQKQQKKREKEPLGDALTPAQQRLAQKLAGWYATAGILVASRDAYDGMLLISKADARAEEVVRAARHNKDVYRWLEKIMEGGDFGSLIVGHGLMLYAILAHHERLPANPQLLSSLGYGEEQILQPPQMPEELPHVGAVH